MKLPRCTTPARLGRGLSWPPDLEFPQADFHRAGGRSPRAARSGGHARRILVAIVAGVGVIVALTLLASCASAPEEQLFPLPSKSRTEAAK